MIVEIVNTGTELLLGEILNTNSQYLSRELNALGFDVFYQTTVGDNPKRLQEVLALALTRADIVVMTGGLGPTRGDITKEIAAEVLKLKLEEHAPTLRRIEGFFAARGAVMPENNCKQALVPAGARILTNDVGTAPGLVLPAGEKIVVLLPGPPNELQYVFQTELVPFLNTAFAQHSIIHSKVLHLRGIGESDVAEKLDALIMAQTNPTIAIYARRGEIIIRITAKSSSVSSAETMIEAVEKAIRELLGSYIYGTDDDSLAQVLGDELRRRKATIAFAESCTGGLASSMLTDIPGSSDYLAGSVVSYSNGAKHELLRVKTASLDTYGAVSETVAAEMAVGVRSLFHTTVGVGITGIAGPGGGFEDKPVGLVYIAVDTDKGVVVQRFRFNGTREYNKLRSALAAFSMVLDKLIK